MNLRYDKIHQAILVALFVSASADVSAAWFSRAPDSQFLNKQQYAYDKQNRPETVTAADGRTLRYRYDAWDNLKQMEFADGKLSFDYDVSGNLTRVGGGQANVNYEHLGNERRLIRRLPNGIRSINQYLPLGQIESIRHEDANVRCWRNSVTNTTPRTA